MADTSQRMSPNDDEDALTRVVRDGVHAETARDRLRVAADKLTGALPLGADAASPTTRKALATGQELLALVKYGLFGTLLFLIGLVFEWLSLNPFNLKMFGAGAVLVLLGGLSLRSALRAWRNLQSIRRA